MSGNCGAASAELRPGGAPQHQSGQRAGRRASHLTVGEMIDTVAEQCERRGLCNASTWLGELALHALPSVLALDICTSSPLQSVASLDTEMTTIREAPRRQGSGLLSSPSTYAAPQQFSNIGRIPDRTSVIPCHELHHGKALHYRRLHRIALGYLQSKEYQRCHNLLLGEVIGDTPRQKPYHMELGGSPPLWQIGHDSSHGVDYDGASSPFNSPPSPGTVRGFRTTQLPPLLQFICLYALYMDGVKMRQMSSNPHRVVHPHLRVLRAYLLEALRNPINQVVAATAMDMPASERTDGGDGSPHVSCRPTNSLDVATSSAHEAERDASTIASRSGCRGVLSPAMAGTQTPKSRKPWTITNASTSRTVHQEEEAEVEVSTLVSPPEPASAPCYVPTHPPFDLLHGDPYLTWLMGVVLRDLRMRQDSATYLLAAVHVNPFLWCAWEDLTSLVSRESQLAEVEAVLSSLEPSFMAEFFVTQVKALLGVTPAASSRLCRLAQQIVEEEREGGAVGLSLGSEVAMSLSEESSGGSDVAAEKLALSSMLGVRQSAGHITTPSLSVAAMQSLNCPRQSQPQARGTSGIKPIKAASSTTGSSPPPLSTGAEPFPVGGMGVGGGGAGTASAGQGSRDSPQTRPISSSAAEAPDIRLGGSAATAWELLLRLFPENPYLLGRLANYYYHQRNDLAKAEALYQQIRRRDPHRFDILCDYSNVLYTTRDGAGMSSLVQAVYQADPFRAETNFAVGNYYVLLGQHDRAVLHFRRTTAIDPQCAEAWLLLGHAYVEVKNTTAAVEAYRTAVDLNERDYRGWYNLGQIYELLEAYHQALYYYWHTTSLRPADPRMWVAVASCLEHDGRMEESIACLEKAESHDANTSPGYAASVRRIASHHIAKSNFSRACVYLEKLVECPGVSAEDLLLALPFLVQQYMQRARGTMDLPARSPSYDFAVATGAPGASPSPRFSAGRNPRDQRRVSAAILNLKKAEIHLERMAELVMPPGARGAPASGMDTSDSVTSAQGEDSHRKRRSPLQASGASTSPMAGGGSTPIPPVQFVIRRREALAALRRQIVPGAHQPHPHYAHH